MNTRYDVAIIGCGEAGIFAGYELKKLRPELNVLVMDQGADIYSRQCPIVSGKVEPVHPLFHLRYHVRLRRRRSLL